MAIKELALITEAKNRKKKKQKETTPTITKPTKEVVKNKKGTTTINREKISTKPTVRNTTQNRVLTNKERLTSKPTISSVNKDIRTVKTTKKSTPTKKVQSSVYDVYERDGRYYYNNGKKEKEIDRDFIQRAIDNKKKGVIGSYDTKGKLKATDEKGNVIKKEKNVFKNAARMGKGTEVGAVEGTTYIADAALQEAQNDLNKGEKLKKKDLPKKILKSLVNSNPIIGMNSATQEASKNIKEAWQDKDKNLLQKGVKTAKELAQAASMGQLQGTKDQLQVLGSLDNSLDEKTEKLKKKINKPAEKMAKDFEKDADKYYGGVNYIANTNRFVGNMAPGIAVSAATKNPNLGIATMGLSAKGAATERALAGGESLDEAVKTGTLRGGIEAGTEKFSTGLKIFGKGPLGQWASKGIFDDVAENLINSKFKNKVANFVAKSGLGIAGEIGEEIISDIAGVMIDKGTIDPNAKYTPKDFWDTVKYTFGSTAIINLITGGYSPSAFRQNKIDMQNYEVKQAQVKEVEQRVASGEVSPEKGQALVEQVKKGTYEQNKVLDQIANEKSQEIQQSVMNGQLAPQQGVEEMQVLDKTLTSEREKINNPEKYTEKIKTDVMKIAETMAKDPSVTKEEFVKDWYSEQGEQELGITKQEVEDLYDKVNQTREEINTPQTAETTQQQEQTTENNQEQIGKTMQSEETNLKNKYNNINEAINDYVKGSKNIEKPKIKIESNSNISNIDYSRENIGSIFSKAKELVNNIGKRVFNNNNEEIHVDNSDIKESINNTVKDRIQKELLSQHMEVYSHLDQIIENGELIAQADEMKNREKYKDWNYYATPISIDGNNYIVEFDTVLKNNQRHFRLQRIIDTTKKQNPATGMTDKNQSLDQIAESSVSKDNIQQNGQKVNTGPEILDKMPTEKKSIFNKLKEKYNAFRHHFTDHREAWYDLSRETGNEDINSRADAIDLANGKAQVDIGRNQVDLNNQKYTNFTNHEEISKLNKQIEDIQKDNSISEADKKKQIEKLNKEIEKNKNVSMSFEGAYDMFPNIPVKAKNEFLVHQLNIDRLNQGVKQFPEITYQDSQKAIEQLRKDYEDIDNWSENIYQYYRNLAQKLVDAGRLPQEKVDEWQKTTPHYVHIQKDVGKKGNTGVSTKSGKVDSSNLIQKVKGGSYPILPIKQVTADYTRNAMEAIQMNQLGQEYVKTVGVSSTADNTQEIKSMDDVFGFNQNLIKDDGKGTYTFVVYDKGVPVEVPISKDMYEGLKPRDIRKIAVTSDIVKAQRELITNKNPVFGLFRNPAKDFQAMFWYSQHPFTKSVSTYSKLFSERTVAKNTPLFDDGVTSQEMVDLFYDAGNQANSFYNNGEFESEKGKFKKGYDKATSPLTKGNNFMESMPRITEFANTMQSEGYTVYNGKVIPIQEACDARINDAKEQLKNKEITQDEYNKTIKRLEKAKKKAKKPTATAEQATMRASHDAAEITVNFKRGGTWGKNIDKNFAVYSSPAIQGASKFGRTITEAVGDASKGDYKKLTRLVSRAAVMGVAPAVLSAAMYGGDDDYEELQDYLKDNYYLIRKPNGKWLRIPKGREISVLQSATRRGMEKSKGKEFGVKDYGTFALNQVGPTNPLESNFASPLISAFLTNMSWSGNPIVSKYMKDKVADENQFNEKTDEFSKWIGKQTKISPMKINYVLDQYLGVIGDVGLPYITPKATNDAKGPLSAIIKNEFTFDQANSSKNVNEFYNSKNRLTKKLNKKTATEKDKVGKAYLGTISQELYPLTEKKRNIQMDKNLSKKEKYEKALEVQKQMNKLTKEAVKNLESAEIGEYTATIGGKTFYRNEDARNGTGWSQESEKTTEKRKTLGLSPEKYYYYKNEESFTTPDGYTKSIVGGKNAKRNMAIVDAFNFDTSDYLEYTYKLSQIKGKKNSKGYTIRGTRQPKVLKYINSLPISAAQKAYLYKTQYSSYKGYDGQFVNTIKKSNLSSKEKQEIYSYLKLGR